MSRLWSVAVLLMVALCAGFGCARQQSSPTPAVALDVGSLSGDELAVLSLVDGLARSQETTGPALSDRLLATADLGPFVHDLAPQMMEATEASASLAVFDRILASSGATQTLSRMVASRAGGTGAAAVPLTEARRLSPLFDALMQFGLPLSKSRHLIRLEDEASLVAISVKGDKATLTYRSASGDLTPVVLKLGRDERRGIRIVGAELMAP